MKSFQGCKMASFNDCQECFNARVESVLLLHSRLQRNTISEHVQRRGASTHQLVHISRAGSTPLKDSIICSCGSLADATSWEHLLELLAASALPAHQLATGTANPTRPNSSTSLFCRQTSPRPFHIAFSLHRLLPSGSLTPL